MTQGISLCILYCRLCLYYTLGGVPLKRTMIGGQAVMEGVMMKNLDNYAVAVRKPDHEIEIMQGEYVSLTKRHAF